MIDPYDYIYLAPHLDDVVLSCGGQIYMLREDGRSVLIVTLMAGDPPEQAMSEYALTLHDRWELQRDVVASRRAEDIKACRALGADYLHWEFPDCIYRTDGAAGVTLYNSNNDIFGQVHAADQVLIDSVSSRLQGLSKAGRFVAPLTVGNHVDHQITRLAAEAALPSNLIYYEEFPYVLIPGAVEAVTGNGDITWAATTITLTEAALQAKIGAIAAYESQLSSFFRSREDLDNTVRHYSQTVGGERIWQRGPAV
jgi:LmbE family N-acetylglucosaminyl deacetylase